MCGIVGVIVKYQNGFTRSTEDCFYQMLFSDTLRRDDSTGVVFVENDSSFGIMKDAYPAPYMINEFQKSTMGGSMIARGKAMIGHNRKATIGSISNETAHPFVVDNSFAMVHNGTLRMHKQLADTTVDSEALAIHLSKVLDVTFELDKFEEAMGKVNGAFAVAAYSQVNNQVYLTRNSERPLAYIDTPSGLFFASEPGMLIWICGRNSVDMSKSELKVIKPHQLITFDLDTNQLTEVDYSPKKATPVITQIVTGGKGKVGGTVNKTSKSISKNQFKQMRHHWMGKRLTFYADDYIEKDFPKTVAEGAFEINLIGSSDNFTCAHTICGEFDLAEMAPNQKVFVDCLYTGLVSEMSFNKMTGEVTFTLKYIRQVPTPTLSLPYANKPTVH